ncbi:cobalamin biosynthesis family protein [Photobacterium sanguinicancri]|uniref:Adenosylcobinamide-phosphate synthase n=1 Tax=Photobacterium sanguinicancri TaxID=875932 RepID=A0ABX4G145_9GAMM|nr:cobalamin biosynthesis family protein [Photobacterium sanguinicancri]KXI21772.1 adenosylcobinamide-phosphate synthase [Photobacterium sanguinicancri]OZS44819.1 adenosylcobinamide-phosphate synthase [Photobacterium sanguinicancri]
MNDLLAILANNSTLLAMWGAIALHWLIAIPQDLHPLNLWQRLAIMLASRVNKPNDNRHQRLLSGLLTWSLMWLTMLIMLIACKQLVWIDALFDLTLLWFALGWKNISQLSHQLIKAYSAENKTLCRRLLSTTLNRQTESLSLLGLGKAGAETQLLGYGRQVIGVLFWYGLAGGIGALMYRLAVSLARVWSPTRKQYVFFGYPAIRILAVLDIVPLRLFALLIALGQNGKVALRSLWQQGENWQLPGPGWLLVATGNKLSLSLGGPAIYEDRKLERPRLGGKIAPAALHLAQIEQVAKSRVIIWLVVQSCLIILFQGAF